MNSFWNKINGTPDPHTYQSTVTGQEVTNSENIHLYSGLSGAQNSPVAYYKNNYTLFGMMGNIETNHKTYMYLYNHRTDKVTIAYDWGSYTFGDYHSHPNVLWLNDGRALVVIESNHNTEFVVKRSLNPYDITSYETIATITDDVAYNNLTLVGDRIYITCRSYPLIENGVRYSDDNGETWSTLKPILNTGSYSDYWAYPKTVFSKTKLMHFVSLYDTVVDNKYSDVYYLESVDGVNYSNKAGTYTRNIDSLKLSKADLDNYYLVRTISPHFNSVHATCSYNNEPFYALESPTTDGAIDFGYWNGSAWATKEITVSGIKLRDANRMELLSTGADAFTLYCCEYATFTSPEVTTARIVKITTTDAFDTWSEEYITDGTVFDYSVGAPYNFSEFNKGAVICLTPKVYGSGADTDPLLSYANFKIVDVI